MKIGDIVYLVRPQHSNYYAHQVEILTEFNIVATGSSFLRCRVKPLKRVTADVEWQDFKNNTYFCAIEDHLYPNWEDAFKAMRSNLDNTIQFRQKSIRKLQEQADIFSKRLHAEKLSLEDLEWREINKPPSPTVLAPQQEKYISPFTAEEK